MTVAHTPDTQNSDTRMTEPGRDTTRLLDTPEMIDRLATEMRTKSGGELPHAFCVEQVKRQLAGQKAEAGPANRADDGRKPAEKSSVFHAWAIGE